MKFFSSRFFFLLLLGIAMFVATGLIRASYQHYQLRQEISSLEAEIQALSKKKLESMELLSYVMSPAFAEERARVELNLKEPGEHVAVIRDTGERNATEEVESTAGQEASNPIKWWYYFF